MQPNVVLIGIDNLRFDLVETFPDKTWLQNFVMDSRIPATPTLNALASDCFWFQKCVSAAGYTAPSFATTFTGQYPYRHGVGDFLYSQLRPDVPTIFEMLRIAGYRTAWLAREPWLIATPEVTRGIDVLCRSEAELFEFVRANQNAPLCLFIHFFDCHRPWLWTDWDREGANDDFFETFARLFGKELEPLIKSEASLPPDSYESGTRIGKFLSPRHEKMLEGWNRAVNGPLGADEDPLSRRAKLVGLYLEAIAKFDRGRLASFLTDLQTHGLWDSSYIFTFSDHGEIWDRGVAHQINHGAWTDEEVTRVVCMLHGPDIPTGVNQDLVGLVDLTPTLIELLDLPHPDPANYSFDGRALTGYLRGESNSVDRWYLQEGWVGFISREVQPTRFERALRTSTDLKYVLRGEVVRPDELQTMTDEELLRFLAESYYSLPWEESPDLAHLRDLFLELGGGVEAAQIMMLRREEAFPHFCSYDLKRDPFQQHPRRIAFAVEFWEDYAEKYSWILDRSRPCNPRAPEAPSATSPQDITGEEDEQELIERLRALGYHD
jgi:hypothetical protein